MPNNFETAPEQPSPQPTLSLSPNIPLKTSLPNILKREQQEAIPNAQARSPAPVFFERDGDRLQYKAQKFASQTVPRSISH
jgi:hypothetical protein